MKLSCALVACNENTHYLDFWPVVKESWWRIVGIPCVMVYVGAELPEHLVNDKAVIHFKPIEGWPTATQAQCIRLLWPALLQCDGAVVLSDMDMIPMQKDFFHDGFGKFTEQQFVSLRGIDEKERQIYMCYVGATPSTWSDLFGVKSEADVRQILTAWSQYTPADGEHGGEGWCTDQIMLYNRVKQWQAETETTNRVGLIGWTAQIPRLDRGNPSEWWYWTPLLEEKIRNKAYVDFHMPPFDHFKPTIQKILDTAVE